MIVHFKDVGRYKKSWDVKCDDLSEEFLEREIRKKGQVLSSNIDFYDVEQDKIYIFIWNRCIGRIYIEEE